MTHSFEFTPNRSVFISGKEYLFFSGYAYLGVNSLKPFRELIKEGIDKYGIVFPSSRISNTQLDLYRSFEALLSNITGSETTVGFPSGYVAGKTVTGLFPDLINAKGTHPAISNKKYASQNFNDWAADLAKYAHAHPEEKIVFSSDSLNPLTASVYDFSFLNEINNSVTAIIDDSHGIGLLGKDGKGAAALLPEKENIEYVFTYSLSKAFGITGGGVSCKNNTGTQLRSKPEYTASTSISPAFMFAFLHAQNLYSEQREKLRKNIAFLKNLDKKNGLFSIHEELPVIVLPSGIDEEVLYKKGIIISSFAYPDPSGKKTQRAVLNALHSFDDIAFLYENLIALSEL
ncbi:MAG: aminotransferase class I/II-fold pyridoxal phosphate-dependent enzyme [Chitinophagaceae bacterium]|jgi:7-keto-8-aminopelargonate synthetase-like enzyme|nr:aminotransferase class I/II-fold pyridoxal phosphate-dependent enzyme [Chitinophagaceae bacterium]